MNQSNFSQPLPQQPNSTVTRGANPVVTSQAKDALNAAKPTPLVYTVEEAAAALNVSTKTIRRFLMRGVLTSSKALRKKLIPRSQIEAFLKATCDTPKSIR